YAALLKILNLQARRIEVQNRVLEAEQLTFERRRQHMLRDARIQALCMLVAGLSHEVNNPLGFACSNLNSLEELLQDARQAATQALQLARQGAPAVQIAEVLESGQCCELLADGEQCLRESLQGLDRLASVVRRLNSFCSLSVQGQDGVNLSAVVERAVAKVLVQHPTRRICFEAVQVPPLRGSREHLVEVVEVLLDNALKNSPPDVGVEVHLMSSGGELLLSVRDSGRGIAPERIDSIFEPFSTDKFADWRGTGLGLASLHGIVLAHGGRVEVSSQVGKGSMFIVCLPHSEVEAERAVDPRDSTPEPHRGANP
ncbi:MAG: sensor histidine kinase, partial [Pseudomonadota bacterium]